MQGVQFARTHGRLGTGDALMIYSDGIIESRGHDLTEGTDRMLGAASDAMVAEEPRPSPNAVQSPPRARATPTTAPSFVIVRR